MNVDNYKANMIELSKNRKLGISGIMRVKDDGEFIRESIESCISALDELIIVYNDCNDESPDIIKEMCLKYPQKIKAYEYTPKIYSTGLSEKEYYTAKTLPKESVHLLANYCNFALCKTNYKYVTKIDADQIYYSDVFKQICDAYRGNYTASIKLSEILSFVFLLLIFLLNKIKLGGLINVDTGNYFAGYQKCTLKIINKFKIPISLSGINLFYNKKWYVTLGSITKKLNILTPYNGVGDTIIFKVTPKTYFVPVEMGTYSLLNSSNYAIIERLVGLKPALPFGFVWFHLNGIRRKYYTDQIMNYNTYSSHYMLLKDFMRTKFNDINHLIPEELLSKRLKRIFRIIHNGSITNIPFDYINNLHYDDKIGLYK